MDQLLVKEIANTLTIKEKQETKEEIKEALLIILSPFFLIPMSYDWVKEGKIV